MTVAPSGISLLTRVLKRTLDIVGAAVGLLLLSPVMLLLALRIRQQLGAPVIFSQVRPGRDGTPFRMYKFRSMTDARDANGQLLPDAERLPPFGQRLRSSSLDELPELWNVLKGDMSLVGPRPLLMGYLPLYNDRQRRRHEVRPGITGWAQINGRNALDWPERFELDVWYVEHLSLWLDIRILLQTVAKVIRRDGISADGEATMSPFTGNTEDQTDGR